MFATWKCLWFIEFLQLAWYNKNVVKLTYRMTTLPIQLFYWVLLSNMINASSKWPIHCLRQTQLNWPQKHKNWAIRTKFSLVFGYISEQVDWQNSSISSKSAPTPLLPKGMSNAVHVELEMSRKFIFIRFDPMSFFSFDKNIYYVKDVHEHKQKIDNEYNEQCFMSKRDKNIETVESQCNLLRLNRSSLQ